MEYALAELDRRFANAVSLGSVHSVDARRALLRVAIGELVSDWLPWLTQRAGTDRNWWCPSVGEQCVVLAPSGDLSQGVVLLGLYQSAHPAPSAVATKHLTVYSDGTRVEYDTATHKLAVNAVGDVTVKAPRLTVDTPLAKFTGDIEADGDVKAGSIRLRGHRHGGVRAGGDSTGAPQ